AGLPLADDLAHVNVAGSGRMQRVGAREPDRVALRSEDLAARERDVTDRPRRWTTQDERDLRAEVAPPRKGRGQATLDGRRTRLELTPTAVGQGARGRDEEASADQQDDDERRAAAPGDEPPADPSEELRIRRATCLQGLAPAAKAVDARP